MVLGRGSNGRGGGQVGRGGSGTERGGSSRRGGGDGCAGSSSCDADKIRSNAARIPGSYQLRKLRNYGVAALPTFAKRESERYRRRGSSPSAASLSSRQRPSTALVVKMEEDDAPAPAFKPGDYLNDAELERLLLKLGVEARLVPGNFVDERHLDTLIGLVSRSSQRDADNAEEWRLVAEEQGKIFIDLGSDGE